MRVAVVARAVAPLHGVGGLERSVHDLVRHLAKRDIDVTLITPPPNSASNAAAGDRSFSSPRITRQPIPYRTFPFANRRGTTILDRSTSYPMFGKRAGLAALELVEEKRVDIVHGFGASVLGYARAKRRASRRRSSGATAPLVFNPQGLEEFGATSRALPPLKHVGYAPLRRAVLECAAAADCIIATDESLAPTVARHLRAGEDRIRTVPNGIDLDEVTALAGKAEGQAIRQRYSIGASDIIFLSVGRLERNKGFDLIPAALARSCGKAGSLHGRPWRWVVVGDGPMADGLRRRAAESHIAEQTIFTGRVNDHDLHAWYEAAALFVHPTRYEGSSLVTLEAMAHRKPILASNAGGLPDKVRPGENGWLIPPNDADALARALAEALSGLDRLPGMGDASRRIVERKFDWAILIDRQIRIYTELLAAAGR